MSSVDNYISHIEGKTKPESIINWHAIDEHTEPTCYYAREITKTIDGTTYTKTDVLSAKDFNEVQFVILNSTGKFTLREGLKYLFDKVYALDNSSFLIRVGLAGSINLKPVDSSKRSIMYNFTYADRVSSGNLLYSNSLIDIDSRANKGLVLLPTDGKFEIPDEAVDLHSDLDISLWDTAYLFGQKPAGVDETPTEVKYLLPTDDEYTGYITLYNMALISKDIDTFLTAQGDIFAETITEQYLPRAMVFLDRKYPPGGVEFTVTGTKGGNPGLQYKTSVNPTWVTISQGDTILIDYACTVYFHNIGFTDIEDSEEYMVVVPKATCVVDQEYIVGGRIFTVSGTTGGDLEWKKDSTDWAEYSSPVEIKEHTYFRAHNINIGGYDDSEEVSIEVPYADCVLRADYIQGGKKFTITSLQSDGTIQYSFNGTSWSNYTSPITKTTAGKIYARTINVLGYVNSQVKEDSVEQADVLITSEDNIDGKTFTVTGTSGGTLQYSIDNKSTWTVYSEPVHVTSALKFYARNIDIMGYVNSKVIYSEVSKIDNPISGGEQSIAGGKSVTFTKPSTATEMDITGATSVTGTTAYLTKAGSYTVVATARALGYASGVTSVNITVEQASLSLSITKIAGGKTYNLVGTSGGQKQYSTDSGSTWITCGDTVTIKDTCDLQFRNINVLGYTNSETLSDSIEQAIINIDLEPISGGLKVILGGTPGGTIEYKYPEATTPTWITYVNPFSMEDGYHVVIAHNINVAGYSDSEDAISGFSQLDPPGTDGVHDRNRGKYVTFTMPEYGTEMTVSGGTDVQGYTVLSREAGTYEAKAVASAVGWISSVTTVPVTVESATVSITETPITGGKTISLSGSPLGTLIYQLADPYTGTPTYPIYEKEEHIPDMVIDPDTGGRVQFAYYTAPLTFTSEVRVNSMNVYVMGYADSEFGTYSNVVKGVPEVAVTPYYGGKKIIFSNPYDSGTIQTSTDGTTWGTEYYKDYNYVCDNQKLYGKLIDVLGYVNSDVLESETISVSQLGAPSYTISDISEGKQVTFKLPTSAEVMEVSGGTSIEGYTVKYQPTSAGSSIAKAIVKSLGYIGNEESVTLTVTQLDAPSYTISDISEGKQVTFNLPENATEMTVSGGTSISGYTVKYQDTVGSTTASAIAKALGYLLNSSLVTLTVSKVDTPVITTGDEEATIACDLSGSTICYTTDGSTPTKSSTIYTEPITSDEDIEIKSLAYKNGYVTSDIVSKWFYPITNPLFSVDNSTDIATIRKLKNSVKEAEIIEGTSIVATVSGTGGAYGTTPDISITGHTLSCTVDDDIDAIEIYSDGVIVKVIDLREPILDKFSLTTDINSIVIER